jgi:N-methylhydantoinase A
VWFGPEHPRPARLYHRDRLEAGNRIAGPAVLLQYDTTTVIPPGWSGEIDTFGNLLLERSP